MSEIPLKSVRDVVQAIKSGNIMEYLHTNVELKKIWAQQDGQKVSALANKTGNDVSWMVIGVTDDGKLAGHNSSWAKDTEEVISQHFNQYLDPVQTCKSITVEVINESLVLIVEIRNPGDVVYWGSQAYCASGTTQKKMEPDEILALRLQLPGLTDYTRQSTHIDFCDAKLLGAFRERVMSRGFEVTDSADDSVLLKRLSLSDTQAARLLFGKTPFRLVRYDMAGEIVSNETWHGLYSLLTQSFQDEIQDWTAKHNANSVPPYPPRALKEAFSNAVAHACYFEQDGDIILELFPTHLVLSNLCLKECRYFANRWFSRSHKTVNAFLMEILRIASHVDELGRGKNLIFTECIRYGKQPPLVQLQIAGKYLRWALTLNGNVYDERMLRLFEGIKAKYGDSSKAMIAQALVLWRNKPVSEIKNYIDDSFSDLFAEVLTSSIGPIFYYKEEDRITLHRWARLLLEEGKDSKQFAPAEETAFRSWLRGYCLKFHDGYITPRQLRRLAHFSESSSARTLSTNLLKKWAKEDHIKRKKTGMYQFLTDAERLDESLQKILAELLSSKSNKPKSTI